MSSPRSFSTGYPLGVLLAGASMRLWSLCLIDCYLERPLAIRCFQWEIVSVTSPISTDHPRCPF